MWKKVLEFHSLIHSYGSGYSHAYGSEGYHQYMRNYDPSYDAFFTDGPSVEDKWKSTYPYVPTSYVASSDGKRQIQQMAYGIVFMGYVKRKRK